ncbi:hypothetical protein EC396_16830 [Lutibacter sp. HS1-25]|uniref:carboxypeptidase-like regulatory domain-containing protein n=1 Tax=Lutibacter sp. HS1-25 TaxID=2485000 RepID=UPI0010130182|nr:carboxypeptidase-like regulatory domain-containing protein [Lutibacter sp. HS1-25]RXP44823.1 hypothetical protein EC396_16830 [Lutibacter sp. HS1-25]
MKTKLTYSTLFVFLAWNAFSQEKTTTIYGKIHSGDTLVENVHVFNMSKKTGVISNDLGEFNLQVSLNDTLYISSLTYQKTTVKVTSKNIETNQIIINLNPLVNELKEVFIRHLTGNLAADIANRPIDTIPKHNFVFKLSDLKKELPYDSYAVDKRPNAQSITDPLGPMGATASLPDKRYQQELKLKRELAQKKDFPNEIKKDLGIDYFTNVLKIPHEKINHFLSYCEYQNIIFKYYNNQVLEVIEILTQESKNYNAIKN